VGLHFGRRIATPLLDSRCLVALRPAQDLLDYAKHLLVAAMAAIVLAEAR
jgi:hypothetical protein